MKNSGIKPLDANAQADIVAQLTKSLEKSTSHTEVVKPDPSGILVSRSGEMHRDPIQVYVQGEIPEDLGQSIDKILAARDQNPANKPPSSNVPHGPYAFTSHGDEPAKLEAPTLAQSFGLADAFQKDASPLGVAWNQVVNGTDSSGDAKKALFAEVKAKIQGTLAPEDVDGAAQAIVDYADGLHDRLMTVIRNVR